MRWLLKLLVLIAIDAQASAIDLGLLTKKMDVSQEFEVIAEPVAGLRVEAMQQAIGWQSLEIGRNSYTFGITDTAYWARATVVNKGRTPQSFYLVSEDPRTDDIDFYCFDGEKKVLEKHTGDHTPFASREFFYRGFAFLLHLQPGEQRRIYMRFHSTAPMEIDLRAYPRAALEEEAGAAEQIGTLYFGAMASIILFNFLLFVSSRERIYLLYCAFQLVTAGAIAVSCGTAYGMLWPESPFLNALMSLLLPSLSPALALLFTASYLNVRESSRRLAWSLYGLASVQTLAAVLATFSSGSLLVMRMLYLGLILTPVLVLTVSIAGALKKDRYATLFLVAWVPLILAAFGFSLMRLGYAISPWPQGVELAFGSIWEAVFLSVCLGDKFNQIKKQELIYLRRIRDEALHAREATLLADVRRREKAIVEREAINNRNLVRVICHDLANPLNIILNYANIYTKPEMSWTDAQRYLKKMYNAAVHQQHIIEHVREFESINSGKIEIRLMPVSIAESLQQLEDLLHKRLEEKNIRLIKEGVDAHIAVLAEPRSLVYNVLANLLSNAIKFSPDGSAVTISVTVHATTVDIICSDQGIGMDAEMQSRIFDITSPTTRPGLKGEKGTGFGLPIVKSYVERYQGTLRVESTSIDVDPERHGTRFILTLRRPTAAVVAA